jgi:hypothetical protein
LPASRWRWWWRPQAHHRSPPTAVAQESQDAMLDAVMDDVDITPI